MSDSPAPKRRWMTILLVISLAVNLLVVGVILGTALRFRGGDHAKTPPGFGIALYQALPKEDRKKLRGELSGLRGKGSYSRKQDFAGLSTALRTVPFDPEAVQVLLNQQALATENLQRALHQEWLVYVTEMSDGERQIYAERLDEVVKRGAHRNRKHKRD